MSLEASHDAATGTTNGQVWYSTNNGASWTRSAGMTKTTGVGRITVTSSPLNRLVVFAEAAIPNSSASTALADFFRSQDGGKTWTALSARDGPQSRIHKPQRGVGRTEFAAQRSGLVQPPRPPFQDQHQHRLLWWRVTAREGDKRPHHASLHPGFELACAVCTS